MGKLDIFTFRVKEGATERQDMKTEAGRHTMEGEKCGK